IWRKLRESQPKRCTSTQVSSSRRDMLSFVDPKLSFDVAAGGDAALSSKQGQGNQRRGHVRQLSDGLQRLDASPSGMKAAIPTLSLRSHVRNKSENLQGWRSFAQSVPPSRGNSTANKEELQAPSLTYTASFSRLLHSSQGLCSQPQASSHSPHVRAGLLASVQRSDGQPCDEDSAADQFSDSWNTSNPSPSPFGLSSSPEKSRRGGSWQLMRHSDSQLVEAMLRGKEASSQVNSFNASAKMRPVASIAKFTSYLRPSPVGQRVRTSHKMIHQVD
ncbi:MAG: hypothetical protein SGPRY_012478, partial [Prymnesium sp.]